MSDSAPIVRLALEDGSVFEGVGFGACAAGQPPMTVAGEVVFNTAMTGYQEALTDPSYAGQILTMTAPLIGNYGVNPVDVESARPQVVGFIIRELSRVRSNYRSTQDLSDWLAEHRVPGLAGIDTRALVRALRIDGAMRGVVSSDPSKSDGELIETARSAPRMTGQNLAAHVSVDTPCEWGHGLDRWEGPSPPTPLQGEGSKAPSPPAILAEGEGTEAFSVIALDCGGKSNIYRHLVERGCRVTVMPFDTPAEAIFKAQPDGVFISNGPGDPAAVEQTVGTLRAVAGQVPTFGICLGHQLLALALGAETFKLKFGHRGANQPVRNLLTDRVEITSQNHGFAVDADSLGGIDCEITHLNLNDGTVAGIRHRSLPIFSVQHHPEASPGPHDATYLFDAFIELMRTGTPLAPEAWRRVQCRPG